MSVRSMSLALILGGFLIPFLSATPYIQVACHTYFVARDKETDAFLMLKFDFTTERFVRLPLPFQSFNLLDVKVLSVVRDEKLSVLHIDDMSHVMRIWVTNKIDDDEAKTCRGGVTWSWKWILINLNWMWKTSCFLLDEENKVAVVCCDKFTRTMFYIVGEDIYKQVYEDTRNASPSKWPLVLTYVPSLVCLH
ncbi:hypothetical protein Bca52824_010977 [Brassica carinata]|uniref:F-box associated beta-propeller type 1 domain-containing protein n=1 Tax=Brassica carinata TaxID=52824 RepID=A0A8X7WEI5_BRACI|nr:hypothetical protein Bca52824_010977 [Brassica carinata]